MTWIVRGQLRGRARRAVGREIAGSQPAPHVAPLLFQQAFFLPDETCFAQRPPWSPSPASFPPGSAKMPPFSRRRSEEHTSELQSRGHLVCRLLLAKKEIVPFESVSV